MTKRLLLKDISQVRNEVENLMSDFASSALGGTVDYAEPPHKARSTYHVSEETSEWCQPTFQYEDEHNELRKRSRESRRLDPRSNDLLAFMLATGSITVDYLQQPS